MLDVVKPDSGAERTAVSSEQVFVYVSLFEYR